MTYLEKLVAVLKVNGKILREKHIGRGDAEVLLPFGSEYTILLQNLHSRRAVVNIEIDGEWIGHDIIVEPGKENEVEIERFLKNRDSGNRFRFIQKTSDIIEHKGESASDGRIRVEFWFEKRKQERIMLPIVEVNPLVIRSPFVVYQYDPNRTFYYPYEPYCGPQDFTYSNSSGEMNIDCGANANVTIESEGDISISSDSITLSSGPVEPMPASGSPEPLHSTHNIFQSHAIEPHEDEGITVPGSKSNQKFNIGHVNELEENSEVIVLNLKGYKSDGKKVEKPILTKKKISCPTCGFPCKSSFDFCPKCTTALT